MHLGPSGGSVTLSAVAVPPPEDHTVCPPHIPWWHHLAATLSQYLCPSALGPSPWPLAAHHKSLWGLWDLSLPQGQYFGLLPLLRGGLGWCFQAGQALALPLPCSQASGARGTVPELEAVAGSHQPTLCIPTASLGLCVLGLGGRAENSLTSLPRSTARLIPLSRSGFPQPCLGPVGLLSLLSGPRLSHWWGSCPGALAAAPHPCTLL